MAHDKAEQLGLSDSSWIDHDGLGRPVGLNGTEIVSVEYAGGAVETGYAMDFPWSVFGATDPDRITAWRRSNRAPVPKNETVVKDVVYRPRHYLVFPDTEALDIIKAALTDEEFRGYLKGNALKYRLRAGKKDKLEQDIAKAQQYADWLFDLAETGKICLPSR